MNGPRQRNETAPEPAPEVEPPGRDDDPAQAPQQEVRERESLERLREQRRRGERPRPSPAR